MSSAMVSGGSSEAASSKTAGREENPIEVGDSSTNGDSGMETENEGCPEQSIVKQESVCNENGEGGGSEAESDQNGGEKKNDDNKNGDEEKSECNGEDTMNIDAVQGVNKSAEEEKQSKSNDEHHGGDYSDKKDNNNENNGKNSVGDSASVLQGSKRMTHLWGNIESMSEITKSPYEGNECAEVGEDCFEELRLLMNYSETDGKMNPRMVSLVGDKLARDLCHAHHEIGKSGMLYSANWKEGKIRDSDFGWIPKRQLLLCLHEHRFAKGGVTVLQAVTKNLDCTKLVLEAMRTWQLMDTYPNLVSNKNEEAFMFVRQKICCYKCQIFVARSFATLQILNKKFGIEESLTKKIKACLSIMNEHVRVNQIELARMTKKAQKRKASDVSCLEDPEVVTSKSPRSRDSENCTSQAKAAPSGVSIQRIPKPKVRSISATASEKETRKRRRKKVPKKEEREESIFMLFDTMHTQVQRLNQMMSFFQSQLQDHRGILKDEIKENLAKRNTKG